VGHPRASGPAGTALPGRVIRPSPTMPRRVGAIGPSWTVAGRRLISQLPAPIVAVGRPASVTACLRWLPIWLPAVGDPAVIGLHISGFADRSLNSRPSRQLSPVPDHRGLQRGLYHVQQRRLQLAHNLPSCLAHAVVPLMINRQEARGCTCCTRSGRTVGTRQDWSGCPLQNARHRRGRRAKYPPNCTPSGGRRDSSRRTQMWPIWAHLPTAKSLAHAEMSIFFSRISMRGMAYSLTTC